MAEREQRSVQEARTAPRKGDNLVKGGVLDRLAFVCT